MSPLIPACFLRALPKEVLSRRHTARFPSRFQRMHSSATGKTWGPPALLLSPHPISPLRRSARGRESPKNLHPTPAAKPHVPSSEWGASRTS